MSEAVITKEQRILRVLRRVLGSIIRDTTPGAGMPPLLHEQTREDIRGLFALIAEREAELAEEAGLNRTERQHFSDEPQSATVVKFHKPAKKLN